MQHLFVASLTILLPVSICGVEIEPPRDGTYLIRLLFVRHGLSCANIPWNACTTNATQISEEGMGSDAYADFTKGLDRLMREPEPVSMEGMQTSWGIRPRGWQIPGHSKTPDGLSDDCIVKANLASLVNDDYDDFGNLIAVRQLVRDPHIVSCAMAHAHAAYAAFAPWRASNNVSFDLVASSSLKRAMETALIVFGVGSRQRVTVLPYANEMNEGTPYQPENYPYSPDVQARQMSEIYSIDDRPELSLIAGAGLRYPGSDQQIDKFKAVLAMEMLPRFAHQRAGGEPPSLDPNPEVIRALEAGRAAGHAAIPVHSTPGAPPLQSVDTGRYRYEQGAPLAREDYHRLKAGGAEEFVVGVGSHHGFLRAFCEYNDGEPGPRNLAVLEKLMGIQVSSHAAPDGTQQTIFTVLEGAGRCDLVMQPPEIQLDDLSASDLGEACRTPLDVAEVMNLKPEPAHGSTPCMTAAQASLFTLTADQGDITSAAGMFAVPSVLDPADATITGGPFWFLLAVGGGLCIMLALGVVASRWKRAQDPFSSPRWRPLPSADSSQTQHQTE